MNLTVDIAWPVALPLPFVDYSGTNRNATIGSDVAMGPIERRSRFEKFYVPVAVTWNLSEAQYQSLLTFFATTLGNGAAAFSIELRYPKNFSLTSWLVRFVGGLSCAFMDGIWKVSAKLELIDQIVIADLPTLPGYGAFMVLESEDSGAESVPFHTSDDFEFQVISP